MNCLGRRAHQRLYPGQVRVAVAADLEKNLAKQEEQQAHLELIRAEGAWLRSVQAPFPPRGSWREESPTTTRTQRLVVYITMHERFAH